MRLDIQDSENLHCVPVCYHSVQSGRWQRTLQRELFVTIRAEVLHSYLYFCVVLCIVCFVTFSVLFVCVYVY